MNQRERIDTERLPPGPTSRIDAFKTAGLRNYRSDRTLSLVDATSSGRGAGTVVKYTDGRTCGHTEGLYHDCVYVNVRNSKINAAVQLAARSPRAETSEAQRFCEAMDELCGTPGWTVGRRLSAEYPGLVTP